MFTLLQRGLFNPIEKTRTIEDAEFQKYLDIRKEQMGPTNPRLVKRVKEIFYESHAEELSEAELMNVWNSVVWALEKNAALAEFALDYGGARSSHFFPWLMSVKESSSEALEMAYGYARNLRGEFEYAGEDPWYMDAVRNLPTLAFHRERQLAVANLVAVGRGTISEGRAYVVTDLGAGRMDWARMHGLKLGGMLIRACDKDPSIVLDKLFPDGTEANGIFYRKIDIAEALQRKMGFGSNIIIMQGVASYYPTEMLTKTLAAVHGMLELGGGFFFDLQLDTVYYRWSVSTFGWPEMKLAASAEEAISIVERIRRYLWSQGMKYQAEYTLDTYNASPAAVMVTMTKI